MFCVNQHTLPQEESENKHMSWGVCTCRRTGEEQKWHIEGWMTADFHFQLYSEWLKKNQHFQGEESSAEKKSQTQGMFAQKFEIFACIYDYYYMQLLTFLVSLL